MQLRRWTPARCSSRCRRFPARDVAARRGRSRSAPRHSDGRRRAKMPHSCCGNGRVRRFGLPSGLFERASRHRIIHQIGRCVQSRRFGRFTSSESLSSCSTARRIELYQSSYNSATRPAKVRSLIRISIDSVTADHAQPLRAERRMSRRNIAMAASAFSGATEITMRDCDSLKSSCSAQVDARRPFSANRFPRQAVRRD